jgi:RNA polymerase sigma-70 factor (sigma-E family)
VRVDSRSEREFLDFVTARSHALFRVAFALTGHQQAAEDLLQSALAKTALRWRSIESGPEAYVRKVLYHEHVSWWRRRSSAELPVAVIPDRGGSRDLSQDAILRLTVTRALLRLGRRQRAVLVLRFLEDLSEAEVARIMGCSPGTVASQTSRALARLRQLAPELREFTTPREVRR